MAFIYHIGGTFSFAYTSKYVQPVLFNSKETLAIARSD